ncbi:hypothetical protein ANN_13782 [Periplaneta americana]|uniref:DDE Tnp4 domain-containing protein n=1 Tax=Periplaneta americana TaxID=6978 RepID=A0ABQ8SUH1_PERAM|nr:hypothetical protein ANN_13782 [Periplaneta americana]
MLKWCDIGNLTLYDNGEFKKRFRLSKELVMNLLHEIDPHLEPRTRRNMAISGMNQLLLYLHFYAVPGVLGCVDGIQMRIQSPGGDNAEVYRNRKGYFSLNVQVVANAKLEICDIASRWQGSTRQYCFRFFTSSCPLETGEIVSSYILGDSAYQRSPSDVFARAPK